MGTSKLNSWLTLIANVAVLVGIVVVVFELQQTQTAMRAEASTVRAEMTIRMLKWADEHSIGVISQKMNAGETLTSAEELRLFINSNEGLRYFENMHYQWQLGVLDEEIWQSNLVGLTNMIGGTNFKHVFGDWDNNSQTGVYRSSFVELVSALRE